MAPAIVNQLWYSCQESKRDPHIAVELFYSCLFHVVNIHNWTHKRLIHLKIRGLKKQKRSPTQLNLYRSRCVDTLSWARVRVDQHRGSTPMTTITWLYLKWWLQLASAMTSENVRSFYLLENLNRFTAWNWRICRNLTVLKWIWWSLWRCSALFRTIYVLKVCREGLFSS